MVLLALGAFLAAANLYETAARSTIPLELDSVIRSKEIRREKHPGRDDVHLLRLETGRVLHVDPPIYAALSLGEPVRKSAWSHSLSHGDQTLPLNWSRDFRRMRVVMPLTIAVFAALLVIAVLRSHPAEGHHAD
ncbi:MAG: hypothetical protein L0Y44_02635 [Phycisphaerales bacterium]|nr:hypothetical protein [Phycisphaerales bacterium]